MRFLFFLIVALAVYLLLRHKGAGAGGKASGSFGKADSAGGSTLPERMVSCARCGLHIPMSESLRVGSRYYCGEEHRRLDAGQSGN